MQLSFPIALAAIAGLSVVHAASAATVTGTSPAAFQQEVVTSGTIVSGGSFTTRVIYDSSGNESRAVYEFRLPTLPTGGSFSSIDLNYYVSETQSGGGNASQLRFTTYQGNGVYDAADASRTGGPHLSPLLHTTGAYTQSLPTAPAGRWLGVNAWQEQFGLRTGISRGGAGNLAPAPALTYVASVPDSGTLVTAPIFDALVDASTGARVVSEGGFSINTQEFVNTQRRGLLEYDLAGLPDGARITGASLDFTVNAYTISGGDGPEPRIYGYVGNGTADPADYDRTATLLATGATVTTGGAYSVPLNLAFLNLLLGAGDTLGFLVRGSADGHQFGFSNIENGSPAQLRLTYAVPEPAALAAVLGLGAVALRRRRA